MKEAAARNELGKPTGVRFSHDEKSRIQMEAKVAGLTFGEYVRRCCNRKSTTSNIELATIRELCRIGCLLKEMNTQLAGTQRENIALTVTMIGQQIEHLVSGVTSEYEYSDQSIEDSEIAEDISIETTSFTLNSIKDFGLELAKEVINDSAKIRK